jgi:hypothetical protein
MLFGINGIQSDYSLNKKPSVFLQILKQKAFYINFQFFKKFFFISQTKKLI